MILDGRSTMLTANRVSCFRQFIRLVLIAVAVCTLMSCDRQGQAPVVLNQPHGIELARPDFLQSRAVNTSRMDVVVSVDVGGVNYNATRVGQELPWVGEVFVPEGSDVTVNIEWFEADVEGLPDEYGTNLPLAISQTEVASIDRNRAITIDAYKTDNQDGLYPRLDLDNDDASNLQERIAGSGPNDPQDKPASVVILYNARSPTIDGSYDSLWNTAQFEDKDAQQLSIDSVLIDHGVTIVDEDRKYRWAGMHDGQYLYLMVFAESVGQQTPFGDSVEAYHDDAIDVFWDGDYSRLDYYDGVDDFQLIFPLLSLAGSGSPNGSASDHTRFELGDQSAPMDLSAIEFAICLCEGGQQIYEIKINLTQAGIPIGSRFGFDIQLNNDVDGGERDAKWAWHNDTGADDSWRFPLRLGTALLELPPQ